MNNKEYFKITKIKKLYEANNDITHNYYYVVYGRLYNNEHTMYRKFKFVLWFDIFDVQEYFEKDVITKEDIRLFIEDYAFNTCLSYLNYDENVYYDKDKVKEFYEFCNETIKNYNRIDKRLGGIY